MLFVGFRAIRSIKYKGDVKMKFTKGKVIAAVLGIMVIAGGVSVYKSSINDSPYRLIYMSEEGNKKEKSQE